MKKHLKLSLMMITGLFIVSCAGEGYYGQQGPGGWGPMMHYGFGYGGGMFMGIILLIVIGLLIYFIVRAQNMKGKTPTENGSPLDILKRRYAKGEITREEYEKMKKDLSNP